MVVMSRERKVDFPFQPFLASDKTRKTVTNVIVMSGLVYIVAIRSRESAIQICGSSISSQYSLHWFSQRFDASKEAQQRYYLWISILSCAFIVS